MPDGNVDKQFQKQAIASFFQGIMKSKLQNRQKRELAEVKNAEYERGLKDKNHTANVKFLQDLTENADPKIQKFAYQELAKLNVISQSPDQTPVNELALQYFGVPKGVQSKIVGYNIDTDNTEVLITGNSPLAKIDPSLVGSKMTIGEYTKRMNTATRTNIYGSAIGSKNEYANIEQQRKTLVEQRNSLKALIPTSQKDRFGNYIGDDPNLRKIQSQIYHITTQLEGLNQQLKGESEDPAVKILQKQSKVLDMLLEKYK